MPKVIQPRRNDKTLQVQEFWNIRNLAKAKPTTTHYRPYKEDEVAQRHRYQKPSQQAKTFNPLALLLRRERTTEMNDLYQIGDEDDNTHVAQFLKNVQFRVTSGLVQIKKLVMGRKSIVHNIQRILNVLLSHLEYEDTWPILQAVIKDTPQVDISFWLKQGLRRLVEGVETLGGTNFNLIVFRNLFNTVCVLMQTYFQKLTQQLANFTEGYSATFFSSQNKYIRKFAVQTFSYILTNISDQQYHSFINYLVAHHDVLFNKYISLPQILVQRLKIVKGCLSAASLTHFLSQLQTLAEIFNQQEEQSREQFNKLVEQYIGLVLSQLENREGATDDQILFDFQYVLSALIGFFNKDKQTFGESLLRGCSRFIALYKTDKKRFQPFKSSQTKYINQLWGKFQQFYRQNQFYFTESTQLYYSLSVLIVKGTSAIYYDQNIINFCRSHPQFIPQFLSVLKEEDEPINKNIIQVVLLLSKDLIKNFIKGSGQGELIYKLFVILKKSSFTKLIQGSWLQLKNQIIMDRLVTAEKSGDLLILLRLITLFRLQLNEQQILQLWQLKSKSIGQYQDYLSNLMKKERKSCVQSELYNFQWFSKEIIVFSHHQIGWLSHVFNLFEAFNQALKHVEELAGIRCNKQWNSCWNELIVSRPSAVAILQRNGYLSLSANNHSVALRLLSSRNRQVRLHTLQAIASHFQEQSITHSILSKLTFIDQNQINLDNEREVKRYFCLLEQDIKRFDQMQLTEKHILLEYLMQWSIGFAFTGFKLIENSFVSFLSNLLDCKITLTGSNETIVCQKIMPFLQYYQYRHSRQYDYDVQQQNHLINAFQLTTSQEIVNFVKQDLQISQVYTVQWIGLQRIAQAIKISKRGKQNLGARLKNLVEGYFRVQFNRRKNTITQYAITHAANDVPISFLNPIKTRFLVVMLKLCPSQFVPPFQCLHFTRQEFFQLPTINNIKRNNWQSIWEKKKSNTAKKRIEVEEKASTTVNLQHLGFQEQEIYLHYLWKDILQNNRHKKRIIFDHLRTYLPLASHRIIQILFESLYIDDLLAQRDENAVELISKRLALVNRKELLNYMFILKAMLIHLRQEINQEQVLQQIIVVILAIIQIIYRQYHTQSLPEALDQLQKENEDEVVGDYQKNEQEIYQDQDIEEQLIDKEAKQQTNNTFNYKQHRKELQKLLHTLFQNHQLPVELIHQLLQFLLKHSKTNLAKSCRVSIPGLLLILNVVSGAKQNCAILAELNQGRFIQMLADMLNTDKNDARPLKACYLLWIKIFSNVVLTSSEDMVEEKGEQDKIDDCLKWHSQSLLKGMISYLNGKESEQQVKLRTNVRNNNKKESLEFLQFLKIANRIMSIHSAELQKQWEEFIWEELSKVSKTKKHFNAYQYEKLNILISILSRYIQLKAGGLGAQSKKFIRRIIGLLPNIKDNQQRLTINQLISTHHTQLGLGEAIVKLVSNTSDLIKNALEITMNFPLFFESCSKYNQSLRDFTLVQHQYFLHNLLCYVDNEQSSVRRAVTNSSKQFLTYMKDLLQDIVISDEGKQNNKQAVIELVLRAYRVQLDLLHKQPIQQNDSIFWTIVGNIGHYVCWISDCSNQIIAVCTQPNAELYRFFNQAKSDEQNIFSLFTSISQSNKFKALKLLKSILSGIPQQDKQQIFQWKTYNQIDIPHIITKTILPILEYLIIHPTQFIPNNTAPKSNLASSLALLSLQILPLVSSFLKQSFIKKELKRLVSKLKLSQAQNKKNIAVIKMISQIIQGVQGQKANEKLKGYLKQHGFQEFHQKITQNSQIRPQNNDDDQESVEVIRKKERIPDFYQNLQELESQEAINRNFMKFDRKLMEAQEQNQQEQQSDFNYFLRKQILLPLRTMLMLQNKSKQEQQKSKSKILLSVTITKVLLHLPMDTFLRQFQKVIGKLARLLKKREVQIRQSSRSCLCEIARSVGSQLLYSIIMELRFNLKDNFDRHVFNYTVYRLLQVMELNEGDLDYCIPLVLPLVIDEIYGLSSLEKQLVSRGEVPTLKMQARKKKGLQLLQVLCRYISHHKISYIIQYLEKYLREHLITQQNLGKYDQLLGAISSGLAANRMLIDSRNTSTLLPVLSKPVSQLRQQIKLLNWENKPSAQNSVKNSWKKRKAGKDEVLTLQEQAGRNRSIFKKLSKQIGEKRNKEIVASSLIQFYLVLLSLLIRKQVFTIKSTTQTLQMGHQMLNLLSFLNECVDHRDNRLVSKSLKILHLALSWNASQLGQEQQVIAQKFRSLKKQVSRKMMLMIQQLTLADQELLKQCFVFLNDLVSEVTIQSDILPSMAAIIKLHMPTTQDQPHIPQTYKLLRTIVVKGDQLIYNPFLDDLHKLVRLQIVTCLNKEIRQISKNILSVYLRDKATLQSKIQALNLLQKKQGNKASLTYERVIKEQLTFYLSNLECVAQSIILQLLEQFIENRDRAQLQTFGELILLSLMTARTNQVTAEARNNTAQMQSPVDKLVILILSKLNHNKILSLVQKCFAWLQSQRLSTVRFCGASFLRIILQQTFPNYTKQFLNQFTAGQNNLIARISVIIQQEANQFQMSQSLKRKQHISSKKSNNEEEKRQNKEWNLVLDMMEVSTAPYQSDPALLDVLHVLILLFNSQDVRKSLNKNFSYEIICSIWRMLSIKDAKLVQLMIETFEHHKIFTALSQYQVNGCYVFSDQKNEYSFKKVLTLLLFHQIKLQSILKLVKQIILQQITIKQSISQASCLKILSDLLIILALKTHIKPHFGQRVLPSVISILNNVVLGNEINGFDFCSAMFEEPNFEHKLIQMTVKLSSNELISYQDKNLVQQTSQILKQKLGAVEYFKSVGKFQTNRRQRKQREKVQLAELAITDPQRFAEQKSRKKRKLE